MLKRREQLLTFFMTFDDNAKNNRERSMRCVLNLRIFNFLENFPNFSFFKFYFQ